MLARGEADGRCRVTDYARRDAAVRTELAPLALVGAAFVLAAGALVAALGLHTRGAVLERQVAELRGRVEVLESPAARAIEEGRRDLAGAERTVGRR